MWQPSYEDIFNWMKNGLQASTSLLAAFDIGYKVLGAQLFNPLVGTCNFITAAVPAQYYLGQCFADGLVTNHNDDSLLRIFASTFGIVSIASLSYLYLQSSPIAFGLSIGMATLGAVNFISEKNRDNIVDYTKNLLLGSWAATAITTVASKTMESISSLNSFAPLANQSLHGISANILGYMASVLPCTYYLGKSASENPFLTTAVAVGITAATTAVINNPTVAIASHLTSFAMGIVMERAEHKAMLQR
ncbi:hypothetical protein RFI_03257 [Reticulomyxa filosa]|uniref:Uncharacterized protein n=1 Tax=Reticulomyxa filosa TaxID=46433 RepID=X6P5M0_RETFI|nr:hypothetical protein RFI_03257 [Reticulomyxa filosa]|eukprot:ETO33845.1 hypothetical protein RFI_03257 [Reticulomyxa filosa]